MGKMMRAIGLMSGTSMDGIDVALIETDGEDVVRRGPAAVFPYDRDFRRRLARTLQDFRTVDDRSARPGETAAVEIELTLRHADAVAGFLAREKLSKETIDVIGFHGQTVMHRPEAGLTVQIGDGEELARLTGLNVVYDLRGGDVAAGGQGAPLAPVYHRALVAGRPQRPLAVLNIGGVANVTWVGADGTLVAFDTGPGNALIDDWMLKRTGIPRDADGAAGLAGKVQPRVVGFFLDHPYFSAPPPKSLDRNAFFWDLVEGLSVEDGAATLAAMTAGAVEKACDQLPVPPREWIVCGGGRLNLAIMKMLRERLGCPVVTAEEAGLDGDSLEAEAWAYLAVRSCKGLAISFPGTTGVPRPISGGVAAMP
jgi:anhydro-N-acetylmuramic acid kinase